MKELADWLATDSDYYRVLREVTYIGFVENGALV